MKHVFLKFYYGLMAVLACFALTVSADAQNGKVPLPEEMLNNTAQGNEFWLAVPGNDDPQQPVNALEFYVTSSYDTEVTIEAPGFGFKRTEKLKAFKVVTFSSLKQTANWAWEIWNSEDKMKNGIRISAPRPISVYVLNGKSVSSDGYLGIPTNVWGTQYIHNSYYDFLEVRPWKSGFTVIAKDDQTKVTITLKGKGRSLARTVKGRRIGDTWSVILDKGDTYTVMGDGTSTGGFDMSGSSITGDKPIGLISFHQRVILPFNAQNGRDHIIEMLPPVSAWGKTFYTVEYARDNKGDFFRVVASKDNTTVEMVYMDKKEGNVLGRRTIKLSKAGDFWEDYNYWIGRGEIEGIRGVSVWKSNNPIMICQYSYSANWDNGDEFDPFMIVLTPVEQYLKGTVFQTPANAAYNKNWFGIIAEGDDPKVDPTQKKLRSIVFDGDTLYKKYPQILLNRIPGSNYYWGHLQFATPGHHSIESNTRFGGYIYGFSNFDSYGWPAAMAFRNTSVLDTVRPPLTKTVECGDYLFEATELVKDPRVGTPAAQGKDSLQEDTGIIGIELDTIKSFNYKLELTSPKELTREPKVTRAKFKVSVIDKTKDAYAIIIVNDQADNFSFDTVYYFADKIGMDPAIAQFGKVRLGTTKTMDVKIINKGKDSVKIKEITLLMKKEYTIIAGMVPPELTLASGASHTVTLEFKPEKEGKNDQDPELAIDSLLVMTECAKFQFPVKGRGVRPCIEVEPLWDAGVISVNSEKCKTLGTNVGLRIINKGTDTLTVTGITGVRLPFTTTITFPFKVPPGGEYFAKTVCFKPTTETADSINITLESDSQGADCSPSSLWRGRGKTPGPQITDFPWDIYRIETIRTDGVVYVFNDGEDDVTLTGLALKDPAVTAFTITGTDQGTISPNTPYILRAKKVNQLTVYVQFIPKDTINYTNQIVASFKEQIAAPVEGTLSGGGKLPVIKPTGYIFPDSTEVSKTAAAPGFVTIRNRSGNSDLFIESLREKTDEGNTLDFDWAANATLDNITIPPLGSVQIPVTFTPTNIGRRYIVVNIISDAAAAVQPGNQDPRVTDTVHVVGYGWRDASGAPKPLIEGIDFGLRMLCDTPEDNVVISNDASATDVMILRKVIFDGDLNAFTIDTTALQLPRTLAAGADTDTDIKVTFTPHLTTPSPYKMDVLAYYVGSTEPIRTTVTGETRIVPTTYDVRVEGSDAVKTEAGRVHKVSIIAGSQDWAAADVKNLTLTLQYDRRLMVVQNITPRTGWSVGQQTVTANSLTLPLSSNTPIQTNGSIVDIDYLLTLADSLQWDVKLVADVMDRAKCVTTATTPMEFGITSCFETARLIDVGKGPMQLNPPTEGINGEVTINSSLGITTTVMYEIVNILGEVVKVYGGTKLDAGNYSIIVPPNTLERGTYFVRMTAGPYTMSQQFMIIK